tara:strand:- start:362 stop:1153 length:792 start_codon:yes stop_codon:yes gene_type:complete
VSDDILFEITEKVGVITLNRPQKKNAMNADILAGLMEMLDRIKNDPEIRAGIITGSGNTFSAGADLKARAQEGGGRAQDKGPAAIVATDFSMDWSTAQIDKPLIAAVDGFCLGAGFELALACDIRICSPDAQFGLPEITLGFFPGAGGAQRLVRNLPQSLAMEMLLIGSRIDGEKAERFGLVSRVLPSDVLIVEALSMARKIASHAPLAVKAVKEISRWSKDHSLEESLRYGNALRWAIGQTEDAKEGPRAFSEKRAPIFKGT